MYCNSGLGEMEQPINLKYTLKLHLLGLQGYSSEYIEREQRLYTFVKERREKARHK